MNSSNTPLLETDRLVLRRFTLKDSPQLFAILGDPVVNTFLPMFTHKTQADTADFIKKNYLDNYSNPHGYHYAICQKADNLVIGYIGISTGASHDLGYGLARSFWGKGIVAEAGKAVLARAKADGLPYVTATHDVLNPASGQVMKKLGIEYKYTYHEVVEPKRVLVVFRMYQLNLGAEAAPTYMEYWHKYPTHFIENQPLEAVKMP